MTTRPVHITIPTSWSALSQSQLRFLLEQMADVQTELADVRFRDEVDYAEQSRSAIALRCLLQWSGLTVLANVDEGMIITHEGDTMLLDTATLAGALSALDWIGGIPDVPVRLDSIDGAAAIEADLSDGFTFSDWLTCENLWQGYQFTRRDDLLAQMAAILYHKENIHLTPAETLSIFYWWASAKAMLSGMFPHFLRPSETAAGTPPDFHTLRRNMDTQIRALTKGDITREAAILSMDAIRALTELEAQALEYDEMNKKYGNH